MSFSLADQYYLKAVDSYPCQLEFVLESLQYAEGYDENHSPSLCLIGKIYMEELKDFSRAEMYFKRAIKADLNYVETYKWYSLLQIWLGRYVEAERLIAYGLKISGMDKAVLYERSAKILECQGSFGAAKYQLELALKYNLCEDRAYDLTNAMSRLDKKIKIQRKRSKKRKVKSK